MSCPECGSRTITVEPGPEVAPTASVERAVLAADEGDLVEITRFCWECGWRETREVHVEAVRVESGDETVHERRELVEAVHGELDRIESIDALRDAFAEVERVRRLDEAGS